MNLDYEFMLCYLRSLVLELDAICTTFPNELPPQQQGLTDTFAAVFSIISERAVEVLDGLDVTRDNLSHDPFLRFLGKWLLVLEPFTRFSRMWPLACAYLHPLFMAFVAKSHEWGLTTFPMNTGAPVPFIAALFLETVSLYTDFIFAMVNRGEEMNGAEKYLWIINCCRTEGIRSVDVVQMEEQFLEAAVHDPPENEQQFLHCLAAEIEIPRITALMAFLYKKYQPRQNRKLSAEQKRMDRMVLAALTKQVQMVKPLLELDKVASRGTKKRILLNSFERLLDVVFFVGRSYPNLLQSVKQKCVFLLNVAPVLSHNEGQSPQRFSRFLLSLQNFIVADLSFPDLFKMAEAADDVRRQSVVGLALIISALRIDNSLVVSLFLNQLLSSSLLTDFTSNLDIRSFLALSQIDSLIVGLMDLIPKRPSGVSLPGLFVLLSDSILSVAKIDSEIAKRLCLQLGTHLVQNFELLDDFFQPILHYFAAFAVTLCSANPELPGGDILSQCVALVHSGPLETRSFIRMYSRFQPQISMTVLLDSFSGPISWFHDSANLLFLSLSRDFSLPIVKD
jgi:hypothetical protein